MRRTSWATIASSSAAVVTTWEVSSSGGPPRRGRRPGGPRRRATRPRTTAATASGSAQSTLCHGPSWPSGAGTRSSADDSWPRSARPTVTTRPMLPAAPVTRTRITSAPTISESSPPIRAAALLAGLEHLGVVERLAGDAGGEVGDQADAEHLHAPPRGPRSPRGWCSCRPARRPSRGPCRSRPASRSGGRGTARRPPRRGSGRPRGTARAAGSCRGRSGRRSVAPSMGEWAVRLMWSEISTGVPGDQVSRRPPQPLVSTMPRQPAAAAVRTGWTTAATPLPS